MTPTLLDAERYVGLPYVPGEFDCGSLIALVQRELFGREVEAPPASSRRQGVRGQACDLGAALAMNGVLVERPATGDVALLWESTPHGQPPLNRRWHVGVVFVQHGEIWLLHCANETLGTVLDTLDNLRRQGLHLDGWYRWK